MNRELREGKAKIERDSKLQIQKEKEAQTEMRERYERWLKEKER